jgi:hypothetical protein
MATNINTDHMIAPCGHHDILGYLLDAPCKDCTNYRFRVATHRIWTETNEQDLDSLMAG